jgi:hypothetical protein
VVLWGDRCATVEANLLLGLLAHDAGRHQHAVERAAGVWLERWLQAGLGTNALYTSAYALWTAFRLADALAARALWTDRLETVRPLLLERLRRAASEVVSPQDIALGLLTCLGDEARRGLIDPAWTSALVRAQRYDGSWAGEPLFLTPTRGEGPAWYSSRTVTTAFVWRALKDAVQERS